VSSVGFGVQNMSRKYDSTVPYRPEMIAIIHAAFDRGITFFDTAEAHGPFECERILGESIATFRNKVVITSKLGWDTFAPCAGYSGLESDLSLRAFCAARPSAK
jgi:aryl-alcohol dehydrogenase-like predicted oxidoreductase